MGQFKDQSLATWLTRRAQDVAMNRLALLLAIALLGPSCRVQGAATTASPGNTNVLLCVFVIGTSSRTGPCVLFIGLEAATP